MKFTSDWFSHHEQSWRNIFKAVGWNGNEEKTVVEIGSFEGRSTIWILGNLLKNDESRIYCLDTWQGGVEHVRENFGDVWSRFSENISESGWQEKVVIKKGYSKGNLLDLWHNELKADFVYVDGSHQASDVLTDLVVGFEILKSGGVMICDDYVWINEDVKHVDVLNNPKIAIDAFVNINRRNIRIIRGVPLVQFAFIKI